MDLRTWNEGRTSPDKMPCFLDSVQFLLLPVICKVQGCGVCLLILSLLQTLLPKLSEAGQIQGRGLVCLTVKWCCLLDLHLEP